MRNRSIPVTFGSPLVLHIGTTITIRSSPNLEAESEVDSPEYYDERRAVELKGHSTHSTHSTSVHVYR
jgi:hypothetical protein